MMKLILIRMMSGILISAVGFQPVFAETRFSPITMSLPRAIQANFGNQALSPTQIVYSPVIRGFLSERAPMITMDGKPAVQQILRPGSAALLQPRSAGEAAAEARALQLQKIFGRHNWETTLKKWDKKRVHINSEMTPREREYRYLLRPNTLGLSYENGRQYWIKEFHSPRAEADYFTDAEKAQAHARRHIRGDQAILQPGARGISEAHQNAYKRALKSSTYISHRAILRGRIANVKAHRDFNTDSQNRLQGNSLSWDPLGSGGNRMPLLGIGVPWHKEQGPQVRTPEEEARYLDLWFLRVPIADFSLWWRQADPKKPSPSLGEMTSTHGIAGMAMIPKSHPEQYRSIDGEKNAANESDTHSTERQLDPQSAEQIRQARIIFESIAAREAAESEIAEIVSMAATDRSLNIEGLGILIPVGLEEAALIVAENTVYKTLQPGAKYKIHVNSPFGGSVEYPDVSVFHAANIASAMQQYILLLKSRMSQTNPGQAKEFAGRLRDAFRRTRKLDFEGWSVDYSIHEKKKIGPPWNVETPRDAEISWDLSHEDSVAHEVADRRGTLELPESAAADLNEYDVFPRLKKMRPGNVNLQDVLSSVGGTHKFIERSWGPDRIKYNYRILINGNVVTEKNPRWIEVDPLQDEIQIEEIPTGNEAPFFALIGIGHLKLVDLLHPHLPVDIHHALSGLWPHWHFVGGILAAIAILVGMLSLRRYGWTPSLRLYAVIKASYLHPAAKFQKVIKAEA